MSAVSSLAQTGNGAASNHLHLVRHGDVEIEVFDEGQGQAVVLLPSLGRGAGDFDVVAALLLEAGLRVVRPQPRGIGGSRGPLDGLTMHDLANDIALVVERLAIAPAIIAGHAFGNFVARMLATIRPDLVEGVAMLAGSPGILPNGESPYDPAVMEALARCGDPSFSDEDRIEALNIAFFAPGNDSRVWLDGWNPREKAAQRAADRATPVSFYFAAGVAPVLEMQAARDTIAAPAFNQVLRDALGSRVTAVTIADAGHALLPEQPRQVAQVLAGWIAALPPVPSGP